MNSYLSIDMDYWFHQWDEDTQYKVRNTYGIFMRKVLSLNKPIFFCEYHDEILEDLNKHRVDRLYNVDYHSDIVIAPEEDELEEGSWVSFYKYKDDCVFEWRLPDRFACIKQGFGLCHSRLYDTFPRTKFGYKKSSAITGLKNINWKSIVAVGICESPNWINSEGQEEYYQVKWRNNE